MLDFSLLDASERGLSVEVKGYELHQAIPEEKGLIEEILRQAAEWIQTKGSKQWSGILQKENGKDNHDTTGAIKRGEVYFATIKEEPAGMFLLWDHQSAWDRQLWSTESGDTYMYLHRLAIIRQFAGKGVSQKLIASAKEIARQNGKKAVRLDCIAANPYLNELYQAAGFRLIDTVFGHDAGEQTADFNLYQFDL